MASARNTGDTENGIISHSNQNHSGFSGYGLGQGQGQGPSTPRRPTKGLRSSISYSPAIKSSTTLFRDILTGEAIREDSPRSIHSDGVNAEFAYERFLDGTGVELGRGRGRRGRVEREECLEGGRVVAGTGHEGDMYGKKVSRRKTQTLSEKSVSLIATFFTLLIYGADTSWILDMLIF